MTPKSNIISTSCLAILATTTLLAILASAERSHKPATLMTPEPAEADADEDGFIIMTDDLVESIESQWRAAGLDADVSADDFGVSHEHSDKQSAASSEPKASTVRQQFAPVCPENLFRCENGECISLKWHCDGHYDCDDFSDEHNCTAKLDIDAGSSDDILNMDLERPQLRPPASSSTTTPSPATAVHHPPHIELNFSSPIEPLMLFSTGVAIRGFWMRSRIYFDVVTTSSRLSTDANRQSPKGITEALSIFFDLLTASSDGRPQASAAAAGGSHHHGDDSVRTKSTIVGVDMDPKEKLVYWVELGDSAGVYSTAIEKRHFVSASSLQRRQFQAENGDAPATIVDSGLLSPEDLALDALAQNLYITDAGLPAIVVCAIKGSHCRTLIRDNLHKPRAIIVDSGTGWLTYTDWGDHPGIYLVSMDGQHRETLIDTDVVWPNGLANDYAANHLYWADARLSKIERVDLTTRQRKEIVKETAANPFSLSLFENRLFWSDWSGSDIRTCEKTRGDRVGNNTRIILQADNVYGIHIYHPSIYARQGEQTNPCWGNQCSHMCLVAPHSGAFVDRKPGAIEATCACPDAMTLSRADKATCLNQHLSFVLINNNNYVAQAFPERIGLNAVEKLIYNKEHIIHDVASDWLHYRLFFYDALKQYIYAVDLANKRARVSPFLPTGPGVRGLLYDSWSDNLYWLDSSKGTLSMGAVKAKYERVLRDTLSKPVSMVLDSKQRVFYIAMLGGSSTGPSIMRTNMMAEPSSDVVLMGSISGELDLPVALHLDESRQRLYWADARRGTIESVDLDVHDTRTGVRSHSRLVHRHSLGTVLAFAVYEDMFLWAIKNGDYMYKARILPDSAAVVVVSSESTGAAGASASSAQHSSQQQQHGSSAARAQTQQAPVSLRLPAPMHSTKPAATMATAAAAQRNDGSTTATAAAYMSLSDNKRIIVVDPRLELLNSPCAKRGCSHGCIVADSSHAAMCVCPDAYRISATNHSQCVAYVASTHDHCKHTNMIKCDDGSQCILESWKCDGTLDCDDASDEKDCPAHALDAALAHPSAAHIGAGAHMQPSSHDAAAAHVNVSAPAAASTVEEPSSAAAASNSAPANNNAIVWLILLLLLFSLTGLVTLFILYGQGRLPPQISVSFISPRHDKDGQMSLLDDEVN